MPHSLASNYELCSEAKLFCATAMSFLEVLIQAKPPLKPFC